MGSTQDITREIESLHFMSKMFFGNKMFLPTDIEVVRSIVYSLPEGSFSRNIYDLINDFYIARGINPDGLFIPINEALESAYKNNPEIYNLLMRY